MAPYIILSLLLLTAVLVAQQASRVAELVIYTDLPLSLIGSIGVALLPGALTFSIPLATLAGIIVGFARMGSDSEIVAMRAAGVGSWTMIWPALLIGLVFTGATTYLHLKEAPEAARDLERIMLQGALAKLDSPVEPRTFNTLPRFVIYVRDGNKELGTWGRVFIFEQRDKGVTKVYTARSGRIDSSGEQSELVLTDVLSTTFAGAEAEGQPKASADVPFAGDGPNSYAVDSYNQLRFSINTGRAGLVQRLNQRDTNADSMDWADLGERAASGTPEQQKEAIRILNRRAALSLAPLFFSLLAATLGLRIRRGGRSIGVLLALIVVIIYYLVSLLGESLARVGTVSPYIGPWLGTVFILALSLLFLFVKRVPFISRVSILSRRSKPAEPAAKTGKASHRGFSALGFPNLMDATLFRSLAVSFIVCFIALAAIFNINR